MSKKIDPSRPMSNEEKFKPAKVADGSPGKARQDRNMKDLPRGSEGDRRRASRDRVG